MNVREAENAIRKIKCPICKHRMIVMESKSVPTYSDGVEICKEVTAILVCSNCIVNIDIWIVVDIR